MQQATLFSTPPLVAAATARGGVVHRRIPCRSLLNRESSQSDVLALDPYRGCEFGCLYCFARCTHEIPEMVPGDFDTTILVKEHPGRALLRSLDPGRLRGRKIAIGTATDPYQPAELRYGVTREILEVLARTEGLRLELTTRSTLIRRDLELLERVSARHRLVINVSLISLDRKLLLSLEPKAPPPSARLEIMRLLAEAGLTVRLFLMPVIPGITDSGETLESVIAAAVDSGVRGLRWDLLFLRSAARESFFEFLEADRPRLCSAYRKVYGENTYAAGSYRAAVAARIESLEAKYGLPR